jgi:hypothetical protein
MLVSYIHISEDAEEDDCPLLLLRSKNGDLAQVMLESTLVSRQQIGMRIGDSLYICTCGFNWLWVKMVYS